MPAFSNKIVLLNFMTSIKANKNHKYRVAIKEVLLTKKLSL